MMVVISIVILNSSVIIIGEGLDIMVKYFVRERLVGVVMIVNVGFVVFGILCVKIK